MVTGGEQTGFAYGIGEDGCLLVKAPAGSWQSRSGEASVRGYTGMSNRPILKQRTTSFPSLGSARGFLTPAIYENVRNPVKYATVAPNPGDKCSTMGKNLLNCEKLGKSVPFGLHFPPDVRIMYAR